MAAPPDRLRQLGPVLATLALGAAGGAAAAWLGLPAAWLAGAMALVAAAALAGLPVAMPPRLRDAAFVLLGASMGAGVTPETVDQIRAWPLSLALLGASVATTLFGSAFYLERVHGWDRATARYAAVPGALSSVLALAATSAADLPRVALAQSVRLFTLVALMPALLDWWAVKVLPAGPPAPAAAGPAVADPVDTVVTLAASAALATLLGRLGVPGGVLLGSMVASAVLHGAGLAEGRPPGWLQAAGFVATGALIGSRFRGTSGAVLRRTLPGAFGSVLIALALAAAFAALGAALLGLPFGRLWLAYAPGGVEAMAVMALALGLDPAFVGAHHVVRLVALNLTAPLWGRPRVERPGTAA